MSIFSSQRMRMAVLAAMVCLSGQVASAQVAPVQYWLPHGLFGFGGNWADNASTFTYDNFPAFGAGYGRDGDWRDNFRTGMFVSCAEGSVGLNGLGLMGRASDFGGYTMQSTVAGYAFKGAGDLPVTVYAGFDALNYRPGVGNLLAPFNADTSVAAGYNARAGVRFQPTSNISLSFEAGVTQYGNDGDINSRLLPGQSPLFGGVRR